MLLHKMQKSASLEEVILARRLREHHENALAAQLPAERFVRSVSTAAMGSRAGHKRPKRAPSAGDHYSHGRFVVPLSCIDDRFVNAIC
jgi:hypothetical protein